jgi:hypothetical protein
MVQRVWPTLDAQGSSTALVSSGGSVVERYEYTPDGERWVWGAEYCLRPASETNSIIQGHRKT